MEVQTKLTEHFCMHTMNIITNTKALIWNYGDRRLRLEVSLDPVKQKGRIKRAGKNESHTRAICENQTFEDCGEAVVMRKAAFCTSPQLLILIGWRELRRHKEVVHAHNS